MIERITRLLEEAEHLQATNTEELEALRLKYLSKKGILSQLMADFRQVPAEQKREVGLLANKAKDALTERFNVLKAQLAVAEKNHSKLNLTHTPYPIHLNTRHPLSIIKQKIINISLILIIVCI